MNEHGCERLLATLRLGKSALSPGMCAEKSDVHAGRRMSHWQQREHCVREISAPNVLQCVHGIYISNCAKKHALMRRSQ